MGWHRWGQGCRGEVGRVRTEGPQRAEGEHEQELAEGSRVHAVVSAAPARPALPQRRRELPLLRRELQARVQRHHHLLLLHAHVDALPVSVEACSPVPAPTM